MVGPDDCSNGREAYKAIVDELARERRHSTSARAVRERGRFGLATKNAERIEAFVRSLSQEQRKLLSEMLDLQADSAIATTLDLLEYWLHGDEIVVTFRGEPMPIFFAEGPLRDYVGRTDDWPWPDERSSD